MSKMNRLATAANRYQGTAKRVLCVCSAGLLRSPTTAFVLSQEPYNHNTRAVGISEEYALIHIDDVHVAWANEIVCMERQHEEYVWEHFHPDIPIITLGIPDNYEYRNPELIELIKAKYNV